MQDGPGRQRSLVPTADTLPSSEIRQFIGASVSTFRTDEPIRPATGGQILLACLFGGKLPLKLPQAFWEIPVEAPVHTIYCGLLKQPDKQERTRFPEWSRLAYFRWKGRRSLAECG